MYWIGFPLLNYLKWSLLLTLIGLLIGKCLVLFLRYLVFWYLMNNSFENSSIIYFAICFHGGFDNNGAIIGPRSTRHSNPEEHATYYFTTFSKELLVQVMNAFILFFGYSLITRVNKCKTRSCLNWINSSLKGGDKTHKLPNDYNKQMITIQWVSNLQIDSFLCQSRDCLICSHDFINT